MVLINRKVDDLQTQHPRDDGAGQPQGQNLRSVARLVGRVRNARKRLRFSALRGSRTAESVRCPRRLQRRRRGGRPGRSLGRMSRPKRSRPERRGPAGFPDGPLKGSRHGQRCGKQPCARSGEEVVACLASPRNPAARPPTRPTPPCRLRRAPDDYSIATEVRPRSAVRCRSLPRAAVRHVRCLRSNGGVESKSSVIVGKRTAFITVKQGDHFLIQDFFKI